MNNHIENLNIIFPFLGVKPVIRRKERPFRLTNHWLKKFDTKQEPSVSAFFIYLFFFLEKESEGSLSFHVLSSTQWKDSKDKTEIPRSLSPSFSKIMGKFGKFKSCSISFLGIMSHETHILTKCWTMETALESHVLSLRTWE